MYEDLFFAVKRHLLQCGRNLTTATMIASKVVEDAKKANMSVEDVRKLRDVFIGQEVNKMMALLLLIGLIALGFKVFENGVNVTTFCIYVACALALYIVCCILSWLAFCLVVL